MTERLYYRDAYLCEFSATVTETGDDARRVYLDRSALYPTSGGQPHDTGELAGIPVVDVVDEGDVVAHILAAPLPQGLAGVTGRVDWPRRLDHMQQHTGQHLLSAVFSEQGRDTESVHFGAVTSTIDLAGDELPDVRAAEERANNIVVENRPVTITFESADAAPGLRKQPDRRGTLRIVTIHDLDRSACGGTHVRHTGEIGAVLARRAERTRGRVRVEFVCGGRAIRRARADFVALSAIAASLSTGLDEAPAMVAAQQDEVTAFRREAGRLAGELARHEARVRYESTPPDLKGRRVVVERRPAGGVDSMRALALATAELDGAVFIGLCGDPPSVLLASSPSSELDAGTTLKAALAAIGGRGGGSPRIAQGSVRSAHDVDLVLQSTINLMTP